MAAASRVHDPTETQTLRARFAQRLRARLRQVRGANRSWLLEWTREMPPARLLQQYRQRVWTMLSESLVDQTTIDYVKRGRHWTGSFVRLAYQHGTRLANRDLRAVGVPAEVRRRATRVTSPAHSQRLAQSYLATYYELEDTGTRLRTQLTRAMNTALQQVSSHRQLVAATNDVVATSGTTAVTALANTALVAAVNEALLTSYEESGIERVGVQPERPTQRRANSRVRSNAHGDGIDEGDRHRFEVEPEMFIETREDEHVCDECEAQSEEEFPVSEIRAGRVLLPIHPNCRCRWRVLTEGGEFVIEYTDKGLTKRPRRVLRSDDESSSSSSSSLSSESGAGDDSSTPGELL